MARELPYSAFQLGEAELHLLHTSNGRLFAMAEVAAALFAENPGAFGKDLRAGRYSKVHTANKDVLRTLAALGVPSESHTVPGATMITAETVEALLHDRRRAELVQPFKLALLKLASQEAARLMADGEYDLALPVAMDAVKQGQALFRPAPAVQLFPLYLLAAQANLGLKRARQCEDFLGLASWLALREPGETTYVMRSQLSRLFGQLYAMEGKYGEAVHVFAEDVYYCALEYGATDVRTTLGYYNLAKVFQSQGELEKTMACMDQVVAIWTGALLAALLSTTTAQAKSDTSPKASLMQPTKAPQPSILLGPSQLLEVADMLQDICSHRAESLGALHPQVAEASFGLGMMKAQIGDYDSAREHLERAAALYADTDTERLRTVQQVARQMPA